VSERERTPNKIAEVIHNSAAKRKETKIYKLVKVLVQCYSKALMHKA